MKSAIHVALVFGMAIQACPRAYADVVRFVEGTVLDVPVTAGGASVTIVTPMGQYTYPRSDVAKLEPSRPPEREWPDRYEKAMRSGTPDRVAALRWAIDFGLVAEARSLLEAARTADPDDPTIKRISAAVDRLETPLPDPDLPALLRGVPADHRIARGPHVLLIHQHSEAEAAERVALIEDIVFSYYLYLATLGLELPAPRERISSIWFAHKADYLAFLRDEGAEAFLTTRGYHHATRGIVATYDCRDDPARISARRAIEARKDELDVFSERASKIPPGARVRVSLQGVPARILDRDQAVNLTNELRRQVERREIVLELSRRSLDWGVAAHETIHQLVSVSRLAPRQAAFPNWLQEGFAMQFETIRSGRWAGLGVPSPFRLRDYDRLKSQPFLMKTLSDSDLEHGYNAAGYARAWSLVYFLRAESPSLFVALLDGLRLPDPEPLDAAGRASCLLQSGLGDDLATEEERWRRFMRSIPRPVENQLTGDHPH